MAQTPQLEGKVAVVTGGSRGIGFAITEALVANGASVLMSGLRQANLDAARERLAERGAPPDRIEARTADVRNPNDAKALIDAAVERFGGLDILINNAGVGVFSEVVDLSIEQWRSIIDTNLSGVFYCSRAAIPHLRRRKGGWIINISSLAGKNSFAGGAAYCASKAGLNAFSEALMQEVRYDDIRVSYIMPGSVRTEFSGHDGAGTEWKLWPEDIADMILALLAQEPRALASRIEMRPSKPRQ